MSRGALVRPKAALTPAFDGRRNMINPLSNVETTVIAISYHPTGVTLATMMDRDTFGGTCYRSRLTVPTFTAESHRHNSRADALRFHDETARFLHLTQFDQ